MKIAINGFGRIGRTFARAVLSDKKALEKLEICAINLGSSPQEGLDILFEHDSTMGRFEGCVELENDFLVVNGNKIKLINELDVTGLPWMNLGIDWVVDATGQFTNLEKAQQHIAVGAKNVLITAPASEGVKYIILGVNQSDYDPEMDKIVSLGSCTTNCLVPIIKVILDNGGFESAMMTTVHSYTPDQRLLDNAHDDPRRARAAAINIIPAKTGAEKSVARVFPELKGRLKAFSIRVPTPKVSMVDLTFFTQKTFDADFWNQKLLQASQDTMKDILVYSAKPLVSGDWAGCSASTIVDSLMTKTMGNANKIFAWYDNEFGYSNRLKDFLVIYAS